MKVFDDFKLKNIDELTDWLDEYAMFDISPWNEWFDKNYCKKCDNITCNEKEYAWCELNNDKCRFFQELDSIPDNKQMIKMWLESECE